MKIAILVAMDKELSLLLPHISECKEVKSDIFTHYLGKIGSHDVAVAKCGIGKVNAALSTYNVINDFDPDIVVNTGVAGGAGNHVKIGTLLVADYVAYYDVWCGPGTETGAADGCSVFLPADGRIVALAQQNLDPATTAYGLICSGDRFVSTRHEIAEIKKTFPTVKAVDMESAAIAHVCSLKGKPFNILRVVSDTPGEGENIEQYQNFWIEAPAHTFAAVSLLLGKL